MTLRGVRVIRLSVLTDETTSPERQRGATDYAAALEDVAFDGREAVDLGVSASKTTPLQRPELGAWLRRPGDFDALVAWRFDRLVRSMNDMNDLSKWAAEHRKVIIFAEGPGGKLVLDFRNPLDPVAQLMLTVFAFAAQMEAMAIQERVTGAKAAMRSMPLRWDGGRPPYGYRPEPMDVGWTLVPDPDAAEVIARIVRELKRGQSPTAIAAALTAEGIPAPRDHWAGIQGRETGGKAGRGQRERFAWSAVTIVNKLTSPALLGWKTHKGSPVRTSTGEPVLATAAPLMERAEFDEVQAILDARPAGHTVRADTNALLAHILLCGGCQQPMYLSKLGGRPATYKCGFRSRRMTCEAPAAVKQEWAEEYAARKFLGAVGPLERIATRVIPGYDPGPELAEVAAEFADHQAQEGRQRSKAGKAAWQARADALDARMADLEAREVVPAQTVSEGQGETFAERWERSDDTERRRMMRHAQFTVVCRKGTAGGWRTLDESRMSWDLGHEGLAAAADELVSASMDE